MFAGFAGFIRIGVRAGTEFGDNFIGDLLAQLRQILMQFFINQFFQLFSIDLRHPGSLIGIRYRPG